MCIFFKKAIFLQNMKKGQPKQTDDELLRLVVERMKELRYERGYSQEYVIERTKLNLSQYEAKFMSHHWTHFQGSASSTILLSTSSLLR